MNQLVKSQHLFFHSKHRNSGSVCKFDIDIPERYIECEDDELLSITLLNFSFYNDFYTITDECNSFVITKNSDLSYVSITIPNGNYPISTLCNTINSSFGSNIASWNKVKNKIVFSFNEDHTLTFVDKSYEVLGFDDYIYSGTIIESPFPLNPMSKLSNICFYLDGVIPYKAYNIDNISGDVRVSNLLMCIPFDASPYDMFNYTNNNSEFRLFIYDKRINRISVRLTDYNGNPLTFLPEFTFALKIETYIQKDEDELLQTNKQLLEYAKLNFLSKHMGV
jgi:hypothetical protein